jgi:hypothetical protein
MEGRLREQERRGFTQTREWIAEDWIRELVKHLAPAAVPMPDRTVETILGPYRLDLVVQLGARRVGFTRADGPARRVLEGVWRDAALVGFGGAHVVYHLRTIDLGNHLADCLYAVLRSDKRLFSGRGRTIVEHLASATIRAQRFPREETLVYYPHAYDGELDVDPSGDPEDVIVEAQPRESDESLYVVRRTQAQLRRWFEYARASGLRTAEAVMQRFVAEQLSESDLDA